MDKIILFLARGLGSGLLKPAPGTWGSLLAMLLCYFIELFSGFSLASWWFILICAVLLGKLWESVVYLGAFMVMRFCFGGYHASTHFRCALVSMASYGIFFGIGSCYAFCRDFSIKWGLAYLIIISLKCQIK